jgi:hypothetical protein
MDDCDKTKDQPIEELKELRQGVSEFEGDKAVLFSEPLLRGIL